MRNCICYVYALFAANTTTCNAFVALSGQWRIYRICVAKLIRCKALAGYVPKIFAGSSACRYCTDRYAVVFVNFFFESFRSYVYFLDLVDERSVSLGFWIVSRRFLRRRTAERGVVAERWRFRNVQSWVNRRFGLRSSTDLSVRGWRWTENEIRSRTGPPMNLLTTHTRPESTGKQVDWYNL